MPTRSAGRTAVWVNFHNGLNALSLLTNQFEVICKGSPDLLVQQVRQVPAGRVAGWSEPEPAVGPWGIPGIEHGPLIPSSYPDELPYKP